MRYNLFSDNLYSAGSSLSAILEDLDAFGDGLDTEANDRLNCGTLMMVWEEASF